MRKRMCILFVCLLGAYAEGSAQELEALHIDRGSVYYQPSDDSIFPIGTVLSGEPSWFFSTGATFASGTITNPRIAGPAFPAGFAMEARFGDEGQEYDFERTFNTEAALMTFAPAGDYVFSGTGNGIGAFTETVVMTDYSPIAPKRIVNRVALQDIDPTLPFSIEWEPFLEIGESPGFIEVDIMVQRDWGWDVVWESPEEEGSFGLDPTSTLVEVPAGVLTGHGRRNFELVVCLTRIDSLEWGTVFGSGLKAYVTSTETVTGIKLAPPQGHVNLVPGEWCEDDCYGWMYGVADEWGYSYDLGYVWVGYSPLSIYQSNLGWLLFGGGSMKAGCWFFSHGLGWIYTHEDLGGWYVTLDGQWHDMILPQK